MTYVTLDRQLHDSRLFVSLSCQAMPARLHFARPTGRYIHVSEASCPNFEPRAHARLTGLTIHCLKLAYEDSLLNSIQLAASLELV